MTPILWFKEKTWGLKIGLVGAIVHVLIAAIFVMYVAKNSYEAQWQFYWLIPYYFDFPISLFLQHILMPLCPDITFNSVPYPAGELQDFIMPSAFYFLVGTFWYFCLPILAEKAGKKIATSFTGKIIVFLLITIPIFSSWLTFLYPSICNFPIFTVSMWSIYIFMCVAWVFLYLWLYFINSRKKYALWLLFLIPLLVFYPLELLYFHFIL